jgi:peptidoglycan/xylan/chitin deacetylase (PgdA/CDA1 family)
MADVDTKVVTAFAPPSPEPTVIETASDSSIYLDSLKDWHAHRSLGTRISHRLSRHIPIHRGLLRNNKSMATFTFDDVADSALTIGADILEEAAIRGTFFISTALFNYRTEHWTVLNAEGVRELHQRGHEIGLHGHAHLPVGSRSASQFADDIKRNRAMLRSIDPNILAENFAYPYGEVALARKIQLGGLVRSSRGVELGVNRGLIDTQNIRIIPLMDAMLSYAELDFYLDMVVDTNGWLVFFTHDVGDSPSPFGVSKRMLHFALEGSLRRGIEISTVSAALDAANIRG